MRDGIEGVVFDIDGTVVRGKRVLPGVVDTLAELRSRRIRYAFMTNDNSNTVATWTGRLGDMGIEVSSDEVVTSAIIAADVTAELYPDASIMAVGAPGLIEALQSRGLRFVAEGEVPDVVVMGKDPDFDQARLRDVCDAIWSGAEFVATNYDPRIPTTDGFVPATGPMVKAVAYATGREPLVTGKPSQWSGIVAAKTVGVAPDATAMVGDQLATDIAMGNRAGMLTILVLTGDATRDDADVAAGELKPDVVLEDVGRLVPWMDGAREHEVTGGSMA